MEHIAQEIAGFLGQWFPPEVCAFLISMLPIFELRGGLIAAGVGSVSWPIAFLICVIGNMIPIPFILLFIRKIFDFIQKTNFMWMAKLVTKIDEKAKNKSKNVNTASFWGLFILVAIPLPGTGAWTGALVANILGIKIGRALFIITCGVITAGLITSVFSHVLLPLISSMF
ncbi:MAG: small multi-drug export protein [Clostridia bacterium]|nr:small multi-drug export protein [Clostridia bacterium]